MKFEVSIQTEFDTRLDELRRICFPGEYPSGSAKDRFDDRSLQIFITDVESGELAGSVRLCRGPDSFLQEWMGTAGTIPVGAEVADLGRALVAPKYRGCGLMRILCLTGALCAEELGLRQLVVSVLPEVTFAPMLREIGFVSFGGLVEELEPCGAYFLVQPLVCDLIATRFLRAEKFGATVVTNNLVPPSVTFPKPATKQNSVGVVP